MASQTARLSSKYQIVVPQAAREALDLKAGDELLVLTKPDRVVLIPKPTSFTKRTRGLHAGIWRSRDDEAVGDDGAASYLRDERDAW